MSLSKKVEAAINDALAVLAGAVKVAVSPAKTHQVILVTGWNDSAEIRSAVAHYLVGLRVCAVNMALQVRAELTDTPVSRAEVLSNVEAIVGKNGQGLTKELIETMRNPWIAEGLWHLCLALSKRVPGVNPVGQLIALTLPHIETSEHGIDIAALYQDGDTFGISIIETKAYPNHPNGAINDAVRFYRGVDKEEFSLKIRQAIQLMRTSLPEGEQEKISAELWRQTRCYVPNPHYDAGNVMNWNNTRSSFKSLTPAADRIFIMPHAIAAFSGFFDAIAAEMLAYAKLL